MLTRFRYATAVVLAAPGLSRNDSQSGNANTNLASECASPPYATHDWIADHALAQLPPAEREWLDPFKSVYLLGTEAPDFNGIPAAACQTPHAGYFGEARDEHV